MESTTYIECLTRASNVTLMRFLKILCIFLVAGFLILSILFPLAFFVVVAAGIGVWFFGLRAVVEFEYAYIDKELTVDKIFNKSRRKRVAVYEIDKMEVFAPIGSHRLDEYNARQLQTINCAPTPEEPDRRYVMVLEGNKRLLLEPSEGLVTAIRNVAPRKVFTD